MQKFNLNACVTISLYTVVEAETKEEAIELAGERGIEEYQWGNKTQKYESWIASDYDGEPMEISVDENMEIDEDE
jgi:hypothetical protein